MDIIIAICIVYAVWAILDVFLESYRRNVLENEWKKWLDEHPHDTQIRPNHLHITEDKGTKEQLNK